MKELVDFRTNFNAKLAAYLDERVVQLSSTHRVLGEVAGHAADIALRSGKRMRPFLCALGWQAETGVVKNAVNTDVLHATLGIELFQTATLIHDDIIDQDALRRGGSSLHESLKNLKNIKPLPHQHAQSIAMLAGNVLYSWAAQCMRCVSVAAAKDIMFKMYEKTNIGQMLDLFSLYSKDIDSETVNLHKTSWYSVILPLQTGAAIGGADKERLLVYKDFGVLVGELFQLRDDMLDHDISKEVFVKRARPLQKKAENTLCDLSMNKKLHRVFLGVIQFVMTRTH